MITTKEKRDARKHKTAEIFTPHFLVNEMLDKLPKSVWEENKTFCDPACGNGNMLVHVLYRKLAIYGHDPLKALQSIYGVDIMRDNIQETRIRLLKTVSLFYELEEKHIATVIQNIIWTNLKKFPKGSLDYDFSFKNKAQRKDIDRWMRWTEQQLI